MGHNRYLRETELDQERHELPPGRAPAIQPVQRSMLPLNVIAELGIDHYVGKLKPSSRRKTRRISANALSFREPG
jgi:hypothetical protein